MTTAHRYDPLDPTYLDDTEHQRVVDECYQRKLCHVVCPYTPDQHQEWVVDSPVSCSGRWRCRNRRGRSRATPSCTTFAGTTYDTITWQAACHYRARQIGPKSRDLMQLTGAKVQMVERCSAIDGPWDLRAENAELARQVAKPLMETIREAETELVAGDCQLSNTAIAEGAGRRPLHPLQVLARAYGLPEE